MRRRRYEPRHPDHVERQYGARLVRRLRVAAQLVDDRLRSVRHGRGDADGDDDEDEARSIATALSTELAIVREVWETSFPLRASTMVPLAAAVDRFTTGQVSRQLEAFDVPAIDIDAPGRIGGLTRAEMQQLHRGWASEGAELIRKLERNTFDEIAELTRAAVTDGTSTRDLAAQFRERFGISQRHARLLARDQVGKLNGRITEARMVDAGVTSYEWSTSGDERVRPAHRKLHGTIHRWDSPPSEGHPGHSVQCRCVALVVLG